MTQLIGLACTRCGQRISTVLEGDWCASCGAAIHRRCASPGRSGACPRCGTDDSVSAAHRKQVEADAEAIWRGMRSEHVGWGFLHLASGTVLIGLSVGAQIIFPTFGLGWLLVCHGAVLAGVVQLFRGLGRLLRAARRPPRDG